MRILATAISALLLALVVVVVVVVAAAVAVEEIHTIVGAGASGGVSSLQSGGMTSRTH